MAIGDDVVVSEEAANPITRAVKAGNDHDRLTRCRGGDKKMDALEIYSKIHVIHIDSSSEDQGSPTVT
mgnify:CR=1 FL=1